MGVGTSQPGEPCGLWVVFSHPHSCGQSLGGHSVSWEMSEHGRGGRTLFGPVTEISSTNPLDFLRLISYFNQLKQN